MKSLEFNYKVYKKVKDIPNILSPMDDTIRKVGLHWDSHRLKLIHDNKKVIKKYLKGKIDIDTVEKTINDNSSLSFEFLVKKGKSTKKIISCFDSNIESIKIKNKIIRLLDNNDLLDDDLYHIDYLIKKKLYKID